MYALLLLLGIHYALALMLATVIGVLFNFKTTGILVFKNRKNRLIYKFIIAYSSTYVLNVGILKVCKSWCINLFAVQAVLVLPMASLSYLLNKYFVFKTEKVEAE